MMSVTRIVLLAALSLWLTACGGGELDLYGCRSDSDCKHSRVCVDGVCQEDSTGCTADDQCPLGQHCYARECTVCDEDQDGVFGSNCAGADCDDQNPAVHPGAAELCGDNLDNDCDGATDPQSLCGAMCEGVSCPPGQACDPETGLCVPICTPQCAGKSCGPDACGGSCGLCAPGEKCDRNGQCVAGCEDRCTAGQSQCVANQIVHCSDTDNDGCVEWSEPSDCPQGQSCLEGQCVECRPNCADRECGDDGCGGSCGICDPNSFCEKGYCMTECWDECWWGESYCLSDREFVECGQFDEDPCLEFSELTPCPDGVCDWDTGSCTGTCQDECWQGQQTCVSDWEAASCGNYDNDPCLEYGEPYFCPEGFCDWATGQCGGGCWDECQWGESFCTSDWSYVECADWNGDGCTTWSDDMECWEGEGCDWNTGRCGGECWDECWWGESMCVDEWAYVECGDYDSDYCLEFGQPMPCPADAPCNWNSGRCGDECWDECWPGESYCWDDMSYVECNDWDGDGCFEFGQPMYCPPDSWCDPEMGWCAEPCWDECVWGSVYCSSTRRIQYCGDYDYDYCSEWSPMERCPQGTTCSEALGGCVSDTCQDECMAGERYCIDTWTYVDCGNYDNDSCLEFGPPLQCPDDAPCDWNTGMCGGCQPFSCWEMGWQCGWQDNGCGEGMYCGDCPTGEICNSWGQCEVEGGRVGAGQPCGQWETCPADWSAAWTCVEYPASTDGYCSYPCDSDSDCAVDFPDGCCRELAPGYSVCMADQNLCQFDGAGYLEQCEWSAGMACLPDMYCIEDYMSGSGESMCMLTCDINMSSCPLGGQCMQFDEQSATGVCLPTGDGGFADSCSLADGCVSGLVCLPLHEDYPGYCNTMCNSMFPCPNGFDCVLQDGEGGTWCAELCWDQSECDRLGDWECVFAWDDMTGVCLPRPGSAP